MMHCGGISAPLARAHSAAPGVEAAGNRLLAGSASSRIAWSPAFSAPCCPFPGKQYFSSKQSVRDRLVLEALVHYYQLS